MAVELWKKDHHNRQQCHPHVDVSAKSLDDATKRIDALVKKNKVVLFMKGTKDVPQCGFSAQVVDILRSFDVDFVDVDVLADESVRQAVKAYGKWPTLPQLYINGKLIGGCDAAVDLFNSGELQKLLA